MDQKCLKFECNCAYKNGYMMEHKTYKCKNCGNKYTPRDRALRKIKFRASVVFVRSINECYCQNRWCYNTKCNAVNTYKQPNYAFQI